MSVFFHGKQVDELVDNAIQNAHEPRSTRSMTMARRINDGNNNDEAPPLEDSGSEREFNIENNNNDDESVDESVHVHRYHPSRNIYLDDEASESGRETFSEGEEDGGVLLNAVGVPFIVRDDDSLGYYSSSNNSMTNESRTDNVNDEPEQAREVVERGEVVESPRDQGRAANQMVLSRLGEQSDEIEKQKKFIADDDASVSEMSEASDEVEDLKRCSNTYVLQSEAKRMRKFKSDQRARQQAYESHVNSHNTVGNMINNQSGATVNVTNNTTNNNINIYVNNQDEVRAAVQSIQQQQQQIQQQPQLQIQQQQHQPSPTFRQITQSLTSEHQRLAEQQQEMWRAGWIRVITANIARTGRDSAWLVKAIELIDYFEGEDAMTPLNQGNIPLYSWLKGQERRIRNNESTITNDQVNLLWIIHYRRADWSHPQR